MTQFRVATSSAFTASSTTQRKRGMFDLVLPARSKPLPPVDHLFLADGPPGRRLPCIKLWRLSIKLCHIQHIEMDSSSSNDDGHGI